MRAPLRRRAWSLALCFAGLGCGSTSGPVLERIEPRKPPEFTERLELFVVTSVSACAVGRACMSADPSACFSVSSAGDATYFDPGSVEFVPPDDPRVQSAPRSACFELDLAPSDRTAAEQKFDDLRDNVYELSGGAINLDLRVHEVAPDPGQFKVFEGGTGIFLQPQTLETLGLPLLSPDSDFVFAVTGENNDATGALPKVNPCAGTNWLAQGSLGGSAYTWASTSCLVAPQLRWHFLYQAFFGVRDVMYLADPYSGTYPSCGQGDPDPQRWFPRPSECASDPDSPSCGQANCDETAFAAHVLTAHWPAPPGLIGNHCRNGRTDYDETASDRGGVCDALGR
jgi:hypothetical protein